MKVTWPAAPLPTFPRAHVTAPPLNVPGADADTKVEPLGIVSLMTKLSAGPGPPLL